MKKRNIRNLKGFTLIELLAVIVILAIIALIAVPQILKILNRARKSAAEDTTYGIIKAGETYVINFMMENNGTMPSESLEFECDGNSCNLKTTLTGYNLTGLDKLDFKGTKPTSGIITISNNGNNITTTDLAINNFACGYIGGESICIENGKNELKENGTVIYFNPETNEQCTDYVEVNSDTENKSGCMKWYVFNDTENSMAYNLLLDHNTTAKISNWQKVAMQLSSDTTTWNNKLNIRSITAEEVFEITGKTGFNKYDYSWYYFDTLNQTQPTVYRGEYGWLFDRTSQYCIDYGCTNNSNVFVYGYWTSTQINNSTAWNVSCIAALHVDLFSDSVRGVSPVITIPKNKIS